MANIIKQFKDANGNNIYPIAYAQGGMKMDLLWTNPSPSSSFAAQTVALDLSEYNLILVQFLRATNTTSFRGTDISIVGSASTGIIGGVDSVNSSVLSRSYESTTNGVTFALGRANNESSSDSAWCIPTYIYGIKMSYVVPTTVHGLQYVEV